MRPGWFEDVTKFPEHDFPCRVNCEEYNSTIQIGFETMRTKRIVFGGLCMNSREKVPDILKRIKHLGSYFKEYAFVVFENDSSDGTREELEKYGVTLVPCHEDSNCKLKQKGAVQHGATSEMRMKKMADYRNRLINCISEKYGTYDCVCILDLDIVGPVDVRGFAHSFGSYNQWDCISAQGLNGTTLTCGFPLYYDALAYSNSTLKFSYLNMFLIFLMATSYKVGDSPYRVNSGFCGLALYKMKALQNADYTPKDGKYICEHVILHKNMIDQGHDKIYINPNMIVLVGAQGDVKNLPIY